MHNKKLAVQKVVRTLCFSAAPLVMCVPLTLSGCDKDVSVKKSTTTKTSETPEGTKKTTETTEKKVETEHKN